MHVVLQIGNDKRDRWQRAVIAGETGERLIATGGNISKICPWSVLACVRWCQGVPPGSRTGSRASTGEILRVAREAEICRQELPACPAGGAMINFLWDLLEHNELALCQDADWFAGSATTRPPARRRAP